MSIAHTIADDGEKGAHRLFEEYGGRLTAAALSLCGNETEAKDLVWETIDIAVRQIGSYRNEAILFEWLYGIMQNRYHHSRRRKSATNEIPVAELPDESVEGAVDGVAQIVSALDAGILRDAVNALPPEMREAVVLRYFMEMPLTQIAKFLSLPVGTVKSRLHYARIALARRLGSRLKKPAVALIAASLFLVASAATVMTVASVVSASRNETSIQVEKTPDSANIQSSTSTKGKKMKTGIRATLAAASAALAANVTSLEAAAAKAPAMLGDPADEIVITYDESGTKVTGMDVTPVDGGTVVVSDDIHFGVGILIRLNAPGTLRFTGTVTSDGDVSVTNTYGDIERTYGGSAEANLLHTNAYTTVFRNCNLAEWEVASSTNAVAARNSNPNFFNAYNQFRSPDGSLVAQLKWRNSGGAKIIRLKLVQNGDDIDAKILDSWYHTAGFTADMFWNDAEKWIADPALKGTNFVSNPVRVPNMTEYGYGISVLTMRRVGGFPAVRFEGPTTISGTINARAGAEVVLVGATSTTASRYSCNGAITLEDPTDFSLEKVITGSGIFTLKSVSGTATRTVRMTKNAMKPSSATASLKPKLVIEGTVQAPMVLNASNSQKVNDPNGARPENPNGRSVNASNGAIPTNGIVEVRSDGRLKLNSAGSNLYFGPFVHSGDTAILQAQGGGDINTAANYTYVATLIMWRVPSMTSPYGVNQ